MDFCKKLGRRFPIGYSSTEDYLVEQGYRFVGQSDGNLYYTIQEGEISETIGVKLSQNKDCISDKEGMLRDNNLYTLGETELVIYTKNVKDKANPERLIIGYGNDYMTFISYNGTSMVVLQGAAKEYINAFASGRLDEDEFKKNASKIERETLEKLRFNFALKGVSSYINDESSIKCLEMNDYLRNYDHFSPTHDPRPYGTDEMQSAYEQNWHNMQRISEYEAMAKPLMSSFKDTIQKKFDNAQKLN